MGNRMLHHSNEEAALEAIDITKLTNPAGSSGRAIRPRQVRIGKGFSRTRLGSSAFRLAWRRWSLALETESLFPRLALVSPPLGRNVTRCPVRIKESAVSYLEISRFVTHASRDPAQPNS